MSRGLWHGRASLTCSCRWFGWNRTIAWLSPDCRSLRVALELPMMLCSGGGGRMDYEMLKYFTEFWCSDDTDPYERIYIQWSLSKFFPAKTIGSHVTNWNKNTSVKFRTDVCSSCKLGFDIDLKSLSADFYLNNIVISGIVSIDATVVMNVISVISDGLRPYFMQNMVPNEATGMAITTVLMLLIMLLTPHVLNRK